MPAMDRSDDRAALKVQYYEQARDSEPDRSRVRRSFEAVRERSTRSCTDLGRYAYRTRRSHTLLASPNSGSEELVPHRDVSLYGLE